MQNLNTVNPTFEGYNYYKPTTAIVFNHVPLFIRQVLREWKLIRGKSSELHHLGLFARGVPAQHVQFHAEHNANIGRYHSR